MAESERAKGIRAERELVKRAKAAGHHAVRAPASRGHYDVEIVPRGDGLIRYLVDVKCNTWAGPQSRERMLREASRFDQLVLARKTDRKGWTYRPIYEDGTMGDISEMPPWSEGAPA